MTSISSISPASAISTATGGLTAAERRFGQSAERIASLGSVSASAKAVDPAAETLAQAEARQIFDANAAVLRVSGNMMKRVLDIAV
jgi:flagellar basal body rod protein FlgC